MRKLLLCLTLLVVVVSCGKDNKVASTGATSTAITVNDPQAQSLGSMIDNSANTFGVGQASYYETWNQVMATRPYLSYRYYGGTASTTCTTKDGIFGIDYQSCKTSMSNAALTRSVVHSQIDIQTKRNELKALINSAAPGGIRCSQVACYITNASNGTRYVIDVRYPIQANPIEVIQRSGQVEYLYNIQ